MGITLAALLQRPERPRRRPGRPEPAAAGHRGVAALDADRSDVLAVGDRGHRLLRRPPPQGLGAPHLPGRRQPGPRALGAARTSTTSSGPLKPTLAFGGGPHVCLGQHVARAEMTVAINALLDRLPNLRLDPDAEPPRFIGFYERGATAIPVRVRLTLARGAALSDDDYQPPDLDSARSRARPPLPGDRRRGRLHLERGTDPAADHDRTEERAARTTPLIFGRDGDDYLVVASHGRGPAAPELVPEPAGAPSGRDPGAGRARRGDGPHRRRRREAPALEDRDRAVAELRRRTSPAPIG